MPRINEIGFNVQLLDVLRTKHPHWRDHTSVEQQGVIRETALRPDIVICPPGGIPVILETEFIPAHSVEADAQAESIFERFKEKEFLPANEAYRDDIRQAPDRAVLVKLLCLPEAALELLAILRDQWCAEPSVHAARRRGFQPEHKGIGIIYNGSYIC